MLPAMFVVALVASFAPGDLPAIPALSSDADSARPFVVNGVCRLTPDGGLGFHFATDGTRQLCAIFDSHDGTPLYLSDGQQTLLYDLSGNQIVRVPASRAYVGVNWNSKADRPLEFQAGVALKSNPKKLAEAVSSFRIDRFVSASSASLRQVDGPDGTSFFAAERAGGSIEAVQVPRGALEWFDFTSSKPGDGYYRLQLRADLRSDPPPALLKLPDLAALRPEIEVVDLDEKLMPNLVLFLKNGYGSLAKLALAGGPEAQEDANKILLSPDWDELRERDRKLGGAYRAALAKHGLKFDASTDPPATQP